MYDEGQQRMMARQIALAGGNIAQAAAVLQTESETMRTLSPVTLHALMEKEDFQKLVQKEERRIRRERNRAAERAKYEEERQFMLQGRRRALEEHLWEVVEKAQKMAMDGDLGAMARYARLVKLQLKVAGSQSKAKAADVA